MNVNLSVFLSNNKNQEILMYIALIILLMLNVYFLLDLASVLIISQIEKHCVLFLSIFRKLNKPWIHKML